LRKTLWLDAFVSRNDLEPWHNHGSMAAAGIEVDIKLILYGLPQVPEGSTLSTRVSDLRKRD
jgi:hypothetical protein